MKYIYYVTGVDPQFIDDIKEAYCKSKVRAFSIAKDFESQGLRVEIERQPQICRTKAFYNSTWDCIYKSRF